MSAAGIYLGDELSAAGFRLCGVETRVPSPGDEADCLEQALQQARVVLLGYRCASRIPSATLEAALALVSPLVMVLPDWDGTEPASDPATRVRHVLGIET